MSVRRAVSSHFDARPVGEISLLVLHCISLPPGEFGSGDIEKLFTGNLDCAAHPYYQANLVGKRLSSHFLITRLGEIVQFVSCLDRAWHAGVSCFEGREKCNDFSIGIELEGTEDKPFEEIQYEKLIGLTRALLNTYPEMTPERIVGHEHIAPGRKTDPGPYFDWKKYQAALEACPA